MTSVIARVPYLNCAPFFDGLALDGLSEETSPRQLGASAESGQVTAGPMALADYLRMQDRFERLGNLGIAVRGRCGSVLLFSKRPIRQLGGMPIAITDQSSTSAVLLRLLLEQRYQITPSAYLRGLQDDDAAEAILLIGDDALKFRATNRWYAYEVDLAFEWWLWQHLPCVFAVWAVRKDATPAEKQRILRTFQHQLAVNLSRIGEMAKARALELGLPEQDLQAYLENFQYRLSEPEEQAIAQFARLADAHHLL